MANNSKPTKRQKRKPPTQESVKNTGLQLIEVVPITENQSKVFNAYDSGQNLILTGTAGTGKTFLSLYLALDDLVETNNYHNVVIIRSTVPSRDQGFLPGSDKQKIEVFEAPYFSLFSELYNRGDAYELMKRRETVKFVSTSFLRGTTIKNSIIIVDEIQNMTSSELHTVFTRIGENCKIIFCGDLKQTDLNKRHETTGFTDFFTILNNMKSFTPIEFTSKDIVRSDLVREYIIEREQLELQGKILPL